MAVTGEGCRAGAYVKEDQISTPTEIPGGIIDLQLKFWPAHFAINRVQNKFELGMMVARPCHWLAMIAYCQELELDWVIGRTVRMPTLNDKRKPSTVSIPKTNKTFCQQFDTGMPHCTDPCV